MNAGQIMISSTIGMPKSAAADPGLALLSLDGEQKNVAASFAGQLGLVGMQEKTIAAVNAGITESKPEPESVKPFCKDLIADGNQNNPGIDTNAAGAQMILAAYVQNVRIPMVDNTSGQTIDVMQDIPTVVRAKQVLAASGPQVKQQSVESASSLENPLRPVLGNPDKPTVQVANENTMPAVMEMSHQTLTAKPGVPAKLEPSVIADPTAIVTLQTTEVPVPTIDLQPELTKTPGLMQPVQTTAEETSAQVLANRQHHHGRMPIVNSPQGHNIDTIQNVSPVAAVEQVLDVAQSQVKFQNVQPMQSADLSLRPVPDQLLQKNTSAKVETSSGVVEANVAATKSTANPISVNDAKPHQKLQTEATQPVQLTASKDASVQTPVVSIQHPGRTPIVSALPGDDVDAVQNVSLRHQVGETAITLAAQQKVQVAEPVTVQSTPTVSQSLEEIVFSLQPPISVSNANPTEKSHLPQSKPVLRPQMIMSLDSDQPKNDFVGPGIAVVLSDEAQPAKPQGDDRVPAVSMQAKPEAGLTQKGLPGIVPTDSATATLELQPENDDLVKGTADIRPAALQNTAYKVPLQPVPEARSENGRLNSTLSVTKENIVSQQSLVLASEAPQTSEDSANNGQAQSDSGQTSENQMMTAQIHAQSKTEQHHVYGQVQASNTGLEQPGKDLPEQVAHQVRERLTQHEVKPGNQQITLTLSPENLGELKMNLNLQGQKLSVEIVAENRTIRDAILQHSDSLKDSLARQNISVQSFDVTTNNRGDGNPGHNQNAWKELARQKQEQYWSSGNGYNFPQVDVDSNMMAYKSKNEHAMLDIHY